ncbi:MAG: PGPGW domain-containing protein [Proteobacteria bacterium]|nr:PGPGW domain-containing protein [Pseudomonadota bacterium]
MKGTIRVTYKVARRIAVLTVGGAVLAVGIAMIVAPGPAIIVIPIGLAVLGMEFAWARIWLRTLRERISAQNGKYRGRRAENHRNRHR